MVLYVSSDEIADTIRLLTVQTLLGSQTVKLVLQTLLQNLVSALTLTLVVLVYCSRHSMCKKSVTF